MKEFGIEGLKYFVRNDWVIWYEKKKLPLTDWTITEHKKIFKNKLPEWAKSFSEREISRISALRDRYKRSFGMPDELREMDSWWIERELFIPDLNIKKKVVVERVFDIGGVCKQVSLIHLQNRGRPNLIRRDLKLSPHKWNSSNWDDLSGELESKRYSELLRMPKPWYVYK